MEVNEKYITNDFLDTLYRKIQPKQDLLTCAEAEFSKVREEGIGKLCSVLKVKEIEQMFAKELEYTKDGSMESMGIQIDKYQVSAVEGLDFPVYHIKPEHANHKTILYLHGHDDLGVTGALLDRKDKVRYHKIIPVKLAKEGYDVIAPELIGLGEAGFYGFPKGEQKVSGCFVNEAYLSLAGFSLGGFRVFQSMKTLDFAEKLGLADRVTAFGISGGGMICQYVSVLEKRVKQVLVACYANTFKNSILYKEHCVDNYIPGLLQVGDSYKILSLAAPKPMLTVNGLMDQGFPEEGSKTAFAYLEQVYARLGAAEQYEGRLFEGRHEIREDIIIEWLNKNA